MSLESSSEEEESKSWISEIGKRSACQAKLDETPLVISIKADSDEEVGNIIENLSNLQHFPKAKRARRENEEEEERKF